VSLKLTTDGHKASCGLSAIAELLVLNCYFLLLLMKLNFPVFVPNV